MLKVTDIAFTYTPVTDIAKARAFYEGVLGLVSSHVFEFEGKYYWIEYDIGPAKNTLGITNGNSGWNPKSSAEGTALALEAEDFDAAIAHLRANQVAFLYEPIETPVCRMALIADPDGNTIIIHKCKHAK
jgi:predicted enzyme related to lactoylglutathione lyase